MGNYNLDLMKYDKHPQQKKFLILCMPFFIPIINWPTRVTVNTCTLIDSIFINNYNLKDQQHPGILNTDISEQLMLFHIIHQSCQHSMDNVYELIRIVNGAGTMQYQYVSIIQNIDWSSLKSFRQCQS